MAEMPKPVAQRQYIEASDGPSFDWWQYEDWHEFDASINTGEPLFTAEQVADLMEEASKEARWTDMGECLAEFRAAFCK